jgi:hypothetical protein
MAFALAETYILAAEQALGASLPGIYRAYIAKCNGGELEAEYDRWELHPLEDRTDRKRISRTASHVLRETEQARKWPNFPPGALCIASNGTGDLLVLKREGNTIEDAVYLWSHEFGTITLLAASVEALAIAQ